MLENKGQVVQAQIFELECMREKGLTAAEAAGIVPTDEASEEETAEEAETKG